ncbi:MAG: MCE family protein [Acidimicrobiales bacterium]|nr:MCE family protein [Acidimicrobiales bacterium]
MLERRVYLNIAAFLALFALLSTWAVQNVIRPASLADTYVVEANFSEATGLRSGVEVTYRGHRVGTVGSVSLAAESATVRLDVDSDRALPLDATATIRRRSAVGEPYVAIDPPADPSGATMPTDGTHVLDVDSTTAALAYGDLFDSADELLSAVDEDDLDTVVSELADALRGRGDELHDLIGRSAEVTSTFAARGDDLDRVATELTALTGVLADKATTIADSTDDLGLLVDALAASADDVNVLLDTVPTLAAQVDALLEASYFDIACGLASTGEISAVVGDPRTIAQIVRLLQVSESAAVVIPKAVVDGPDGRYLSGTFGFAPGELVDYPEFETFEDPRTVAGCDQGTVPGPEGLAASPLEDVLTVEPGVDVDAPDVPDADELLADEATSSDRVLDEAAFPWTIVLAAIGALVGGTLVVRRIRRPVAIPTTEDEA